MPTQVSRHLKDKVKTIKISKSHLWHLTCVLCNPLDVVSCATYQMFLKNWSYRFTHLITVRVSLLTMLPI